jgi:hypothetical protein
VCVCVCVGGWVSVRVCARVGGWVWLVSWWYDCVLFCFAQVLVNCQINKIKLLIWDCRCSTENYTIFCNTADELLALVCGKFSKSIHIIKKITLY